MKFNVRVLTEYVISCPMINDAPLKALRHIQPREKQLYDMNFLDDLLTTASHSYIFTSPFH